MSPELSKRQVGRHDNRGLLVEATDHVEQELPAGLSERQITEFVKNDKVLATEIVGDAALTA